MVRAEFFVPEQPTMVRLEMDIETARWLRAKLEKMIIINVGQECQECQAIWDELNELNLGK
jgi:hypothetical protein